jgi:hypothetical protein
MPLKTDRPRRRFFRSGPTFVMSEEDKKNLFQDLEARAPGSVLDEIEKRIDLAHTQAEMNADNLEIWTKEASEELQSLERTSQELSEKLRDLSEEVQYFLDWSVPGVPFYGECERVAMFSAHVTAAKKRYDAVMVDRPKKNGAPAKITAAALADDLAIVWAKYSGRKWSHNGAWGRFIERAFEAAGVDASGPKHARMAAMRYRNPEKGPDVSS